jgi:hypothetical protein
VRLCHGDQRVRPCLPGVGATATAATEAAKDRAAQEVPISSERAALPF